MDKYEYKVRADEIRTLIAEKDYFQAAELADTIDWRRVKSVKMLCVVSDLYKANRRYEDAKNLLLLAYEKKPEGRTICYSLCELCIKTEEFVRAVNYYNEFLRVAPTDPERYILQYKLYEAQDVNLEERIGVLEELKKRDYREKWAYELAYLYHRVGLATRCVEECDELILWFGEGKYVMKAMELKMLHEPLTLLQQDIYAHRFDETDAEELEQYTQDGQQDIYEPPSEDVLPPEEQGGEEETPPEEMDIQVKAVDIGRYNTIELQEEIAAGLQEVLEADQAGGGREGILEVPETDACEEADETEVFFGETGEIERAVPEEPTLLEPEEAAAPAVCQEREEPPGAGEMEAQPPKELAGVLLQETDGQIRMVLPEQAAVERQITGQMKIDDILVEWERMKKESEEKSREEVRQHILRQTGPMFTEFEATLRDSLLEASESRDAAPDPAPAEEPPAEDPEWEADQDGVDYLDATESLEEEMEWEVDQDGTLDYVEAEESPDALEQVEEAAAPEAQQSAVRSLTREERELFAPFIQSRKSREQLVKAIDSISMAAYTGNVVITGEEGMDTLTLAKNMLREVKMTDSNFLGKAAKITGQGLNGKNVRGILEGVNNGALIIQKASGMDSRTAGMLHLALQQEQFGVIVILEDTKKAIQRLFLGTPQLFGDFTSRVDLEALSNETLVSFGRRYAREREYSIDELGMLALHTRVEESQTIDHVVTVVEVKQIVDEAICRANRKTLGHFFDILLARRYDDEDMIILSEKDFVA